MITGIFLAAGIGERFGSQKLLSIIGGKPLVICGLENCLESGLSEIIVVLGYESDKIDERIKGHFNEPGRLRTIVNREYRQGIISSFNSGLACLGQETEGAMMILADMPFIRPSTIDRMIRSWTGKEILLPEVNGKPSHPRIFPADVFPDFIRSGQLNSGKQILAMNRKRIKYIVFENSSEFRDIDTKSDLVNP